MRNSDCIHVTTDSEQQITIRIACGAGNMLWQAVVSPMAFKITTITILPVDIQAAGTYASLSNCDIVAYCTSDCMRCAKTPH